MVEGLVRQGEINKTLLHVVAGVVPVGRDAAGVSDGAQGWFFGREWRIRERCERWAGLSGCPFCFLVLSQLPATTDTTRINLQSANAVNYWCQALNCSETRLRNAVLAVGVLPEDVRAYLNR